MAPEVGRFLGYDGVVAGTGRDISVAVRTEIHLVGLVGLQKPHLDFAKRFWVVHQANPNRTHTSSSTLAKQAAPTNK